MNRLVPATAAAKDDRPSVDIGLRRPSVTGKDADQALDPHSLRSLGQEQRLV
jgi:hypothetical protein